MVLRTVYISIKIYCLQNCLSGAVYHVTSRGNAGHDIFADDGDRAAFLKVLQAVVSRFRWRCHAYCLMDNHYHLLIETPEPNLSRGMRQLNGTATGSHLAPTLSSCHYHE